ncbi:porin [Burkholderia pseudomallei]|uniref:porin n=1 Tax=Burkholderia pseudomallei TaxID=28450 RepID=UPI00059CFA1A|nr:porin [Burkholderia pseudomallei]
MVSSFATALLVAVAAPAAAYAQSTSVTLYGVVDTGVAFVNGVGPSRHSQAYIPNFSGTVPSRWGLRGSEDLGGGNKAIFTLESGFSPDSGVSVQGGRLFGRQALVGLSGSWGQVSLGRQYTMLLWAMPDADLLGPNVFGLSSFDTYLPNARTDNAVAYKGTFGGVTIGATYSFGRDSVNASSPSGTNCAGENAADNRQCREWSLLVKYDSALGGVAAAYDSQRGGPGAFAGLTSSSLKDDRLALNGYVMVGQAKMAGGWLRRNNQGSKTSTSDLYYLGLAYPVTSAFTAEAEGFHQRFHNSANKAWMIAMRGTYALSKRTFLYGTGGFIANRGTLTLSVNSGSTGTNTSEGGNQLGAMVGMKHLF